MHESWLVQHFDTTKHPFTMVTENLGSNARTTHLYRRIEYDCLYKHARISKRTQMNKNKVENMNTFTKIYSFIYEWF
jgi:hypothetical protein